MEIKSATSSVVKVMRNSETQELLVALAHQYNATVQTEGDTPPSSDGWFLLTRQHALDLIRALNDAAEDIRLELSSASVGNRPAH